MAETFLEAIGAMGSLGLQFFLAPLLIFTIVFAALSKTKAISDKMDANAVIAFILAFLVGLFPDASRFIALFIPMMVMLLLIVFGAVIVYLFMGASPDSLAKFFKAPGVLVFFVVMFLIVFGYTISEVFPNSYLAYQGGNTTVDSPDMFAGPAGVTATLFHPKVLGTIVFLVLISIAAYVIVFQPK